MTARLLYIVGSLVQGGLEQQLWYLLAAMDRDRYRPAVLVWAHAESDPYVERFRTLGVPLHTFPRGLPAASKLSRVRRLARMLRPDVVHSYNFYTNFAAEWAARAHGAVRIGSVRRDFVSEVHEAGPCLGRLCAWWPVAQICNSHSAAAAVRRHAARRRQPRLFVVRNGLDLARFTSAPAPEGGPAVLVGLGALEPLKRWDRLLTAAAKLRSAGFDFRIRIAGDGSCRAALERQSAELGLGDIVAIEGYRADVRSLLGESAFLVHTSDAEGCPNAVMEAMASARAVVATDAGDVPDLVDHGRTGFVVRRGDADGLAWAIAQLIADPAMRRTMGLAARARAETEFGLDRLVSQTFDAYAAAGWKHR